MSETKQPAREVLDGMKGRLAVATPGPWFSSRYYVGAGDDPLDPDIELAVASFKDDATFIAAAPTDVARLVAAVEAVLAVADRLKSEAENAEHGARAAAEINDGAGLRAWESEKYAYQQAERLIRAAIEAAWKEGE